MFSTVEETILDMLDTWLLALVSVGSTAAHQYLVATIGATLA